jgi:hypothetical protein
VKCVDHPIPPLNVILDHVFTFVRARIVAHADLLHPFAVVIMPPVEQIDVRHGMPRDDEERKKMDSKKKTTHTHTQKRDTTSVLPRKKTVFMYMYYTHERVRTMIIHSVFVYVCSLLVDTCTLLVRRLHAMSNRSTT